MLGESDSHHRSAKTPARQYVAIERRERENRKQKGSKQLRIGDKCEKCLYVKESFYQRRCT